MPKPKNKEELLIASQGNFERLMALINAIPTEERQAEFPEGTLNRNIRDVLAHLHHWHLMQLNWYEVGMQGQKPDMPAKGYGWKDTPQLNRQIWEDYQNTSLGDVQKMLHTSYQQLQSVIQRHSNEELFEKKRYAWTGSTSLGAYLIANTSSHYDWGYRLIRKMTKK